MTETFTKAEKLQVAAYAAPRLRSRPPRRVKIVDADGKVVRETTDLEVAQQIMAKAAIEFDVEPTAKPQLVTCDQCGGPMRPPKTYVHRRICKGCHALPCSVCGKPSTHNS